MAYPKTLIKTVLLSTFIIVGISTSAHAIKCKRNAQVFKDGSELITPFCQDDFLAKVARSYGIKTTARKIRKNPVEKTEVCRIVGHDSRVEVNCASVNEGGMAIRR